jgi:hypothetical protein
VVKVAGLEPTLEKVEKDLLEGMMWEQVQSVEVELLSEAVI